MEAAGEGVPVGKGLGLNPKLLLIRYQAKQIKWKLMELTDGNPAGNQQSKPAFCQIRIHRSRLKQ
jgi:hypothetical protein